MSGSTITDEEFAATLATVAQARAGKVPSGDKEPAALFDMAKAAAAGSPLADPDALAWLAKWCISVLHPLPPE